MKPKKGDKVNVPTNWILNKSEILSPGIKSYYFKSDRYDFSTSPNILYLGRHFLMTPLEENSLASRLYTLTLCNSP